ncbi:hypothetical protein BDZ89DRAFT_601738 [Hymenopellis radicata]|nr:hypothetical protein BDZ89DRAFT_601738 [Hymenopellis radicata]
MPKDSAAKAKGKARSAPYASQSKANTSGTSESSESSMSNPVFNHPRPKDFKALGYPDYGDLYISQWDSWDLFGLHRNILSQHDLTSKGVKKYTLSEIYALASILELPSGPDSQQEAVRRFFNKDGERKEDILGYLGLGIPVDYTVGDESESAGDGDDLAEDPDYLYGPLTSDVCSRSGGLLHR